MKILIILSLFLVCFAAFTNANQITNDKQVKSYYECVDKLTIKKFTDLAYDLYNNKITLSAFIGKLFTLEAKKLIEISQCATSIHGLTSSSSVSEGTILTKIGITLLYSSNCSKDVGPALIILDQTLAYLKDIKANWKDAIVSSVVFGVISYQSYNDCASAAEAIREVWRHQ